MKTSDKALGRLEEFKDWAKSEFKEIKQTQLMILNKIEKINQDRWLLYGKIAVLNGMLIVIIEAFVRRVVFN